MKKAIAIISVICITAVSILAATHFSGVRGHVSACFVRTGRALYSDYQNMIKKFGITSLPNEYIISAANQRYAYPPEKNDDSKENSVKTTPQSDGGIQTDKGNGGNYAERFYKTLKVKKSGYDTLVFEKGEKRCTVYTLTANKEDLSEFLDNLRAEYISIRLRDSLTNAVLITAQNFNLTVDETAVRNILSGAMPGGEKTDEYIMGDTDITVYAADGKVYCVMADIDYSGIALENAVLDITLSDGANMLGKTSLHLGMTISGRKFNADISETANVTADNSPFESGIKAYISFDRLSIYQLNLALTQSAQKSGFSADGYFVKTGKKSIINGGGEVICRGGCLEITYDDGAAENPSPTARGRD